VPGTLVDLENPQELDLPSVEGRQDPGVPRAPSDADDEAGRTRAAAALDELDWKLERGVRQRPTGKLRLTLTWDGSRGAAAAEAKAVQEALRAIGLQVPFTTASWSYLRSGPLASGQFDLALVRMTARTAGDLAPYFHSRGATNLQGVAEAAVDGAFEAYFRATDRTGRLEASRQLDVALREHHVASVLAAPVQVLLLSRRVEQLEFRDDLPRLDVLRLGGEPRGWHR
jgi:ABC-type transport system substrate-binding protein